MASKLVNKFAHLAKIRCDLAHKWSRKTCWKYAGYENKLLFWGSKRAFDTKPTAECELMARRWPLCCPTDFRVHGKRGSTWFTGHILDTLMRGKKISEKSESETNRLSFFIWSWAGQALSAENDSQRSSLVEHFVCTDGLQKLSPIFSHKLTPNTQITVSSIHFYCAHEARTHPLGSAVQTRRRRTPCTRTVRARLTRTRWVRVWTEVERCKSIKWWPIKTCIISL